MLLTKEEANKVLADTLLIAEKALQECEKIADEYGLSFNSPINAYGAGAWYQGRGKGEFRVDDEDWYNSDSEKDGYWTASSQSC